MTSVFLTLNVLIILISPLIWERLVIGPAIPRFQPLSVSLHSTNGPDSHSYVFYTLILHKGFCSLELSMERLIPISEDIGSVYRHAAAQRLLMRICLRPREFLFTSTSNFIEIETVSNFSNYLESNRKIRHKRDRQSAKYDWHRCEMTHGVPTGTKSTIICCWHMGRVVSALVKVPLISRCCGDIDVVDIFLFSCNGICFYLPRSKGKPLTVVYAEVLEIDPRCCLGCFVHLRETRGRVFCFNLNLLIHRCGMTHGEVLIPRDYKLPGRWPFRKFVDSSDSIFLYILTREMSMILFLLGGVLFPLCFAINHTGEFSQTDATYGPSINKILFFLARCNNPASYVIEGITSNGLPYADLPLGKTMEQNTVSLLTVFEIQFGTQLHVRWRIIYVIYTMTAQTLGQALLEFLYLTFPPCFTVNQAVSNIDSNNGEIPLYNFPTFDKLIGELKQILVDSVLFVIINHRGVYKNVMSKKVTLFVFGLSYAPMRSLETTIQVFTNMVYGSFKKSLLGITFNSLFQPKLF